MEERLLKSSFGLSFLIHMGLFVLAALLWTNPAQLDREKKLVWVELPEPSTEVPEKEKEARIVKSREGYKAEEAAPDAFLGAETRRVQEQTVSKSLGKDDAGHSGEQKEQPRVAADPKGAGEKKTDIGKLGVPILSPADAPKAPDAPEWSQHSRSWGSVSQDYVQGLKEDEASALNTREFIFFSYFERIRKRLDLAWGPVLREELIKMYRTGRRLAGDRDHVTRTIVTLDQRGRIVKVDLVQESGVVSLDKAAVNAFNKAGPFPNPPNGLVTKEGTVQIRWDFVLKT